MPLNPPDNEDMVPLQAIVYPTGPALPRKKRSAKSADNAPLTPEQIVELNGRVSVFLSRYPDSIPADWRHFDGVGYVHYSEMDRFGWAYGRCHYTGKYLPKNQMRRTFDGVLACKEYVDSQGWARCDHSEQWGPVSCLVKAFAGKRVLMVSKSLIEEGEYFRCDISTKFYHRSSRIAVKRSMRYHNVAREEVEKTPGVVIRCHNCADHFDYEKVAPSNWGGVRVVVCVWCQAKRDGMNVIRPHNFHEYPAPICKTEERARMVDHGSQRRIRRVEIKQERLFGVEVETELDKKSCIAAGTNRIAVAKSIKEALGDDFVIVKEDGSLSMNGHYSGDVGSLYAGFEVVTAPADISVHREKWPLMESSPHFGVLRAWFTETCGMHVHVSKEALTTLQIGRILMFVNHKRNKRFIARVAGRSENKYCRAFHKERITEGLTYGRGQEGDGVVYVPAEYIMDRSDDARRQAVNITNPKTIEFRIFRGTVNPRHIIRNIEFCDAICTFCSPGSRSFQELYDWRNFVRFCGENRSDYPMFVEWLESGAYQYLPKRNAYGPKDTRGTTPPKMDEDVLPEDQQPADIPNQPCSRRNGLFAHVVHPGLFNLGAIFDHNDPANRGLFIQHDPEQEDDDEEDDDEEEVDGEDA